MLGFTIKASYSMVLPFKGFFEQGFGHLGEALCPGYPQGSTPWGGGLFGALLLLQEDFHLLLVGFLGSARPLSLGFRLGTAPTL